MLAFFFLASLQLISAQFNIFESMFGQQQQQHPQHSGHAYSDGVSCSQYLCPATSDCVARPKDCPCSNVEDIKCLIPDTLAGTEDATVVCTRGQNGCAEVERLMRRGVKPKKK
ncbi:long chronological lifespan protein 2 [Phlegmacium glaucopus]|nr:long chronological lifespan protein 2 [Phlegmacium glaucopus]